MKGVDGGSFLAETNRKEAGVRGRGCIHDFFLGLRLRQKD